MVYNKEDFEKLANEVHQIKSQMAYLLRKLMELDQRLVNLSKRGRKPKDVI